METGDELRIESELFADHDKPFEMADYLEGDLDPESGWEVVRGRDRVYLATVAED